MMKTSLKATLMLIGAVCVLLFAGGFPRLGAPDVYRGGAMLLLGVIGAMLSLWGAMRLAAGQVLRLIVGMVLAFLALAGVAVLFRYGAGAVELAQKGGAMWAGAVGMGCTALTGLLFVAIFGYLAMRLLTPRLWLAMSHVSVFLVALGAYLDFCGEVTATLALPSDASVRASSVQTEDGREWPLGFSLAVKEFEVSFYDDVTRYEIASAHNGRWENPQELSLRDGRLWLGDESWPLSDLKTAPGIDRPFLMLPGETPRLIMQMPPTVKEYRALCELQTDYKGMPESRTELLRVNEPIECKGWLVSLMSYRPMGNKLLVIMQARRAPGRICAMSGMLGLLLSLAFWCWGGAACRRTKLSAAADNSSDSAAGNAPSASQRAAQTGTRGSDDGTRASGDDTRVSDDGKEDAQA